MASNVKIEIDDSGCRGLDSFEYFKTRIDGALLNMEPYGGKYICISQVFSSGINYSGELKVAITIGSCNSKKYLLNLSELKAIDRDIEKNELVESIDKIYKQLNSGIRMT